MKYRKGIKYEAVGPATWNTGILKYSFEDDRVKMTPDGILTAKDKYTSDGPSGPTLDSEWTIYPAFGHDTGYECIRKGYLPDSCKLIFDACFYWWLLADGYKWLEEEVLSYVPIGKALIRPILKKIMIERRAWIWYNGVYYGGESSTLPKNERPVLETP